MALNPDIRLKVRHFFKKNRKIILIIVVALILLITINRILISFKTPTAPQTTYTPNISILDTSSKVPEKVAESFDEFIEQYVIYCNTKDYVSAYNLISDDCKKNFFGNDYNNYVEYVQDKFSSRKKYAIQNYSNYDNKYIYSVKLFDDFLATGLTNQAYRYQEEMMVASYDENKNIVFSVGNYIESQDLQYMAANDYVKAEVTEAVVKYSFIAYNLKITNRSDYTVVIQDGNADTNEVVLNVDGEYRGTEDTTSIVLKPGETKQVSVAFSKFYDSDATVEGLMLNSVRVMENYTGNPDTAEEEIANAVDKFSMTISFK